MKTQDFSTSITVNATPKATFDAINTIAGWWTDSFEGDSRKLNDEFTVYFYHGVHVTTQKIVEFVPGKKVVWLVTGSDLNFISDKEEWKNTTIVFELSEVGNKTKIDFTHVGLTPQGECFDACSGAWQQYIYSLLQFINTGKGNPTTKKEMDEKKASASN